LFRHFERRYPYLLPVCPAAEECLLVPFYVASKAVGTIWAIMHTDRRKFDAEDDRVMGSLGKFASSAYRALLYIDDLKVQVAEREKAEAELRELATGLEAKIRRLVEANVVGIVMWDLEGAIIGANEAFLRMVQYDREDLASGRVRWTDLTPAEWRDRDERAVADLKVSGRFQPFEKEYVRKDGSRVPVLLGGALFEDSRNEGVAFVLDLTEQKRAQEKLRASERTLRELTETIPQMLWSADTDGAVDYCNQRVLDYTGLSAEQVLGAGWMRVVHQDDRERIAQAWSAAVSAGEPFQHECRWLREADQMYRWCISSALPLRDQEGRAIKWFGSVVDLHDWKEAQQALQITQAELAHVNRVTTMGQLAASISHEVSQPVAAGITNAQAALRWLSSQPPDLEEVRQALCRVVKEGNRAADVIDRIRALIKKAPPRKDRLKIGEAIREVIALTHSEALKEGVSVQTQLAEGLPFIQGDRIRLQQVILNLIMNAIEAMSGVGKGAREVLISTGQETSGGVLVSVQDFGPGLDVEGLDHLFDAFYTTKAGGMGMGLAICRSTVEALGGRIWASRNVGPGATFHFTLPVASAPDV
jgi:PAS domain S-box-containing protein